MVVNISLTLVFIFLFYFYYSGDSYLSSQICLSCYFYLGGLFLPYFYSSGYLFLSVVCCDRRMTSCLTRRTLAVLLRSVRCVLFLLRYYTTRCQRLNKQVPMPTKSFLPIFLDFFLKLLRILRRFSWPNLVCMCTKVA